MTATDTARFDAALMAGGRSQRMEGAGSKALLPWPPPEGPPLFLAQLEKLAQLSPTGSRLLLSCHADQAADFAAAADSGISPLRLVHDADADRGPLGGLAACLDASDADYLVVLAVDLPLLSGSMLETLMKRAAESGRGVVPRNASGRWEPLAAVYPTSLAEEAGRRLASGQLALQDFIDWAVEGDLIEPWQIPGDHADAFENINHPADYAAAAAVGGSAGLRIARHEIDGGWSHRQDHDEVAAEEPLELRVEGRSVAVVMRTPGHDEELAAGFLVTEGVANQREDFFEISQCPSVAADPDEPEPAADAPRGNVVDVLLGGEAKHRDLDQLTRHVFTSSSCGICGKATIDSVFQSFPSLAGEQEGAPAQPQLERDLLLDLPHQLGRAQSNFHRTGGLHASALFDAGSGELLLLREDVGRHNALDKVIGHAVLNDLVPLSNTVLLLSGRISFELMQKALAGGIPVVAGISAPSSLAVQFARESGQTLVGFLRERSFNVYAGEQRLSDGGQPVKSEPS